MGEAFRAVKERLRRRPRIAILICNIGKITPRRKR